MGMLLARDLLHAPGAAAKDAANEQVAGELLTETVLQMLTSNLCRPVCLSANAFDMAEAEGKRNLPK